MHHGNYGRDLSQELLKMIRKEQADAANLGATGEYPHGKLCPEDKGEIQFAVGSDPEKEIVILDFGESPVGFVAMTPQQAVEVAQALIRHARSIAKEPISIVLH